MTVAQSDSYGKFIRWTASQHCPTCKVTVDLLPGVVAANGVDEVRTCPDSGTKIITEAKWTCPPSAATFSVRPHH